MDVTSLIYNKNSNGHTHGRIAPHTPNETPDYDKNKKRQRFVSYKTVFL